MCGRYDLNVTPQAVAEAFSAAVDAEDVAGPRRNVSPTERVAVVVAGAEGRAVMMMRWGFLPRWYKTPNDGPLLINARAETIAEKPAFREAVRARRCLIPADLFYEWQGEKGAKTAYVIRPRQGGLIAFAGVWQEWGNGSTCAIVTCAANATLAPVHHRMPVVVAPGDFGLWLGEEGHGAARLMVPAADDLLEAIPADEETRAILARRGPPAPEA